jgi:hypothetical protein
MQTMPVSLPAENHEFFTFAPHLKQAKNGNKD